MESNKVEWLNYLSQILNFLIDPKISFDAKKRNATSFKISNKKIRDSELVKPCGEQLKSKVWNEIFAI